MGPYRILLVKQDSESRHNIGRGLDHDDFLVTTVNSGEKACQLMEQMDFDLVITDMVMEPTDGIQVLKKAKKTNAETKVILLTGYNDYKSTVRAAWLDADAYQITPCESEDIAIQAKRCLEKLALERKIKECQDRLKKANQQLQLESRENKRLEAKLKQAQKMEAIGTLASGIAHDFNNILWIINGNTELALAGISKEHSMRQFLERIEKAGQRATNLIMQILNFSRQASPEQKRLKISSIVKESIKLLRSSIPSTIDIRTNIASESFTIMAYLSEINQVFMKLCINASYAMRENGGVLEVSLTGIEIDESEAQYIHDLSPGKYVVLSIRDTGSGIRADIIDRIFDPHFTTKTDIDGTGMGLTTVKEIVKNHNGAVTVQSAPGKGAVFHVFLPEINSEDTFEPKKEVGDFSTGKERILFIDDEKALIDIVKQMLKLLGYQVVANTSSVEALKIFQAEPEKFDLIITDQTMPNMTGYKLARESLKIRNDIPIILCTGFSDQISEEKAKEMGIKAFLLKPILMADLAKTVRDVLDGSKHS